MLDALQQILGFTVKDGAYQDMDYGPLGTSLSQGTWTSALPPCVQRMSARRT